MDELLKSLPVALQYVVLAFVGLGIAVRLLQNFIKGWNEGASREPVRTEVKTGNIVAVSTATLADMRPMEEAARKLDVAADTLAGLSDRLADLAPLVPMLKEIGDDIVRLLEIIERQDRDARERAAYEKGVREGRHHKD